MNKTKQNQTETAITELIDQVEKFFSTAPLRSSVTAAPVLPVGYVVNARRIADRRLMLAGYRLADLLTRVTQNCRRNAPRYAQ